jgi:ATP-binding cassette subfamily B protein
MADGAPVSRRFLVPEVIQTSAMDCGPASLKALFGGLGLYLSYDRLREACQTDVDGTSIDTLETVAGKLGLDVNQILMPADLLCIEEFACLPAIVVVRLAGGATHFVVLWRLLGPLAQVMDPAAGRVWIPRRQFLDSLYIHRQAVPRAAWEEWSQSAAFTAGLEHRMRGLGVKWGSFGDERPDCALMDASLRLAHELLDAGKLKRGAAAWEFLGLCARNPEQIPPEFRTIREIAGDAGDVLMCGAVLVAAVGRRHEAPSEPLPESLAAVRSEPPPHVWAPVWSALRTSGWLVPIIILMSLLSAAAGRVFEALLIRGLFDLARHLQLSGQRMAALAAVTIFLVCLLALEWTAALGLLRLGRHLELRLRTRFLLKIPRMSDRYFQSRLISDMAFRAHSVQLLRELPGLAGQFVRSAASLLFTAAAIAWVYPGGAVPAALAVIAAIGVPLVFQPATVERDLRFREISGGLSRFYLDALLGSRAIQAHSAERALRGAHAGQLGQWAEAGLRQQALLVRAGTVQLALTMALVIGVVYRHTAMVQNPAGLLLLIYWLLSIPSTGRQLASFAWNLPALRNTLLRFLEPLGSQEEDSFEAGPAGATRGVALEFDDVTVIAGGHTILDRVSLHVTPGEHVAIVGLSGAGKSSLVGLLLGWHKPSEGVLRVDAAPLDTSTLSQLRRETAWIDPQVHLFNTTLFENVNYGNSADGEARMGPAMDEAGLTDVLERLPDGLQTTVGEGGGLVSGGEGQRVRMARALVRPGIRLAILDEPARGLDRDHRRSFVAAARLRFAGVTLLCVTHDVMETLDFERVLVMEQGRILEQGSPRELRRQSSSRFRELFEEAELVSREMWSHPSWRRLRMTSGVLREGAEADEWTSV